MDLTSQPWFPNWQDLVANSHKQAFLIEGTPESGLLDYGQTLANALLCATNNLCGQCSQCLLLQSDTHPDKLLIQVEDGKKQIGIAQVRALIDSMAKTPQVAATQVAVIYPAEKLTIESHNALLKTLEEPTSTSKIILLSYDVSSLPITVRSRCQIWDAKPSHQQVESWLSEQANQLSIEFSDKDIELAAQKSMYRPLLALDIITQQESAAWVDAFYKGVVKVQQDAGSAYSVAKLLDSNHLDNFLDALYLLVANSLKNIANDEISRHLIQVDRNSRFNFLKYILKSKEDTLSRANVSPQLILETMLISWGELNKRIVKKNGI